MIFKVISNKGGGNFHGIKYNIDKVAEGKAVILGKNIIPDHIKGVTKMTQYFDMLFKDKKNIKNKQLHAVLSVKGKAMALEEIGEVADKLMKDLGYENAPYILVGHNDTKNNHVHIVATRVDMEGKRIEAAWEAKRALKFLDKILERNQKNNVELINNFSFSSPTQVKIVAEAYGYKMDNEETKFFRNGEYQGEFKQKEKSKKEGQERKKRIRQLNQIFKKYEYLNKRLVDGKSQHSEFFREKFGLEFHFHTNEKYPDSPYGLTIIDHKSGMAFKASEFNVKLLKNNEEAIKNWINKVLEKGVNDSNHLKNILRKNGFKINKEGEILYGDDSPLMKLENSVWQRLEVLRKAERLKNAKFVSINEMYEVLRKLKMDPLIKDLSRYNSEMKERMENDPEFNYEGEGNIVGEEAAKKMLGNIKDWEEVKEEREEFRYHWRRKGFDMFEEGRFFYEEGFVYDEEEGTWTFTSESDNIEYDETYERKDLGIENNYEAGLNFNLNVGYTGDGKGGILRRRKTKEEIERERGKGR